MTSGLEGRAQSKTRDHQEFRKTDWPRVSLKNCKSAMGHKIMFKCINKQFYCLSGARCDCNYRAQTEAKKEIILRKPAGDARRFLSIFP
ncbi:MAG: hypothetical protein CML69_06775 [Rhodobacteraceae bacterium]|nr:hypothetical protein [Paracoccaceae bacterium]